MGLQRTVGAYCIDGSRSSVDRMAQAILCQTSTLTPVCVRVRRSSPIFDQASNISSNIVAYEDFICESGRGLTRTKSFGILPPNLGLIVG